MRSEERKEIDKRFLKSYRLLYADYKKDFCEKMKLLPQNLSGIERGDLSCTVGNIYNIATQFGVSLEWIFFGTGEFYKKTE